MPKHIIKEAKHVHKKDVHQASEEPKSGIDEIEEDEEEEHEHVNVKKKHRFISLFKRDGVESQYMELQPESNSGTYAQIMEESWVIFRNRFRESVKEPVKSEG